MCSRSVAGFSAAAGESEKSFHSARYSSEYAFSRPSVRRTVS
jgi:hypothetical protein